MVNSKLVPCTSVAFCKPTLGNTVCISQVLVLCVYGIHQFGIGYYIVRLYGSNGSVVSSSMDAEGVKFVESVTPLKSWSCRLENALVRLHLQLVYIIAG